MQQEPEIYRSITARTHDAENNADRADPYLPYRTLSASASINEYTTETKSGVLPRPSSSHASPTDKLVTFTVNDPENPKNWSLLYKWWCTLVIAFVCFAVAFASSVVTPDIVGVVKEFNVTEEVALLSITVFVIGFGVGPLVFAPLSEMLGRKPVYVVTLGISVLLVIPCALATNISMLLVFRALGGIAISAPMTLVGGSLADLWRTEERGVPMAFFSAAPFLGPAIGPLVGGYLSAAAGWRWLYWIQLILGGFAYLLLTFTVPETYAPTLLSKRAAKLRKSTGDTSYTTTAETDRLPLRQALATTLVRPLQLLFGELIVFLISLYMSVLYGLLYMFFIAFPIVFQGPDGHGFSRGTSGLMFIPLAIGVICSAALSPLVNRHYLTLHAKHGGSPPPEMRLIPMMISCWLIPIGLFIFSWTSYPRLPWIAPALGGFPVGFGFIFLYNAANNYLVDSYQSQAASALAAKTFLRSLWGAVTVLFTAQMYARLGVQGAGSLLAGLALACCAIPFVFFFFGERIRRHSRFAVVKEDEVPAKDVEKA
ncbi:major facilitator superfamily domain-containing protein [Geopyxis carbonaria]|nr:major facilitator superfamily domain-containing protein [Geopyxis carbonaria]